MDEIKEELLVRLGERIAKQRRKRGITLERLAYEMGISKGNLSDIERGKRDARFTTMKAIAEGLDMSLSQLMRDL